MRNAKMPLLALFLAASMLTGCVSTTTPCAPTVIRPKPPAHLLIRPQEPVELSTGGMSSSSTPKTGAAGPSVGQISTP